MSVVVLWGEADTAERCYKKLRRDAVRSFDEVRKIISIIPRNYSSKTPEMFFLYKAGDGNYLTYTDPAGSEAEFPITSARREHGGSYTCRYSNRTVRAAYSEPSDPVQIIVAGEGPSLAPRGPVVLGGAVTVRCECRCAGTRVLLSKTGDPDIRRSMDSAGDVVEFPIRNVSQGDSGSYSCQYSTKWDPPIWSEPSDPVELVVTGEGSSSMSLTPSSQTIAASPAPLDRALGPCVWGSCIWPWCWNNGIYSVCLPLSAA
uniref:Immunoglobulin domain-containing protein n=1 Tax=Chrysemys picta bellii TaxID=8478 RepID=A0A8C3P663_CHRPI